MVKAGPSTGHSTTSSWSSLHWAMNSERYTCGREGETCQEHFSFFGVVWRSPCWVTVLPGQIEVTTEPVLKSRSMEPALAVS